MASMRARKPDSSGLERHPLTAAGIAVEQIPQVELANLLIVAC